jgi:hypothetical protein
MMDTEVAFKRQEAEVLSTGRASVFFQYKMGIDRALTLFTNSGQVKVRELGRLTEPTCMVSSR